MMQSEFTLQTRRESWDKTQAQLGERQAEVFEKLRAAPAGATAWQIAQAVDRPVYTVRPRLTELKKAGHVRTSGKRFFDGTQRFEAVWKIVD